MRKAVVAATAVFCATATGLSAQSIGVGAHIGTTGVGGTVGVGLTSMFGVHGSIGFIPLEPKATFSDLEFTVDPPASLTMLGLDFFPGGGGLHLTAGVLMGAKTTTITGEYGGEPVTIGGQTYDGDDIGGLIGNFETSNAAPFVGIGFGRHAGTGIGLTLDLGVAFMGEPTFTLRAAEDNAITQSQQFRSDLEEQRASVQEDLEKYAKLFPIARIGLRIGL